MKTLIQTLMLILYGFQSAHAQNFKLSNTPDKKILDNIFVTCIAFDKDNNAWIGTFRNGLIKYTVKGPIFYNSRNSCINDTVKIECVQIDSKGNVWIGAHGLIKFDGKTFKSYDSHNSNIPEDYVRSIAIDSKDNIWFTSCRNQLGGLVKYDGKHFIVFTPSNSKLPINLIQSIAIDKNDNVWLALSQVVTEGYLVKISQNKWTVYGDAELGFSVFYFGNIKTNSKNEVYGTIDYALSSSIGGERPSVFTFNGQQSKILKTDKSFGCRYLNIDQNDRIWCSDNTIYDGNTWIRSGETFQGIFAIEQAKDGKIGTGDGVYIQNK